MFYGYPIPPGAPASLRALRCLRPGLWAWVSTAHFAPSFATAMRRSSVSATDRPPRRGLPRPNCHSHWLISYTLLPFQPDSSAASASPCGNLAPRCRRSWCGMVGIELQTLSTVSEALDLGGQRLFLLADQPENLPIRRRQNMKGICIIMAYPWDILTDKRRDILS